MRFSPAKRYPFHKDLNILLRSLSSDTYFFHFSFRVRDQFTLIQYNRSLATKMADIIVDRNYSSPTFYNNSCVSEVQNCAKCVEIEKQLQQVSR